MQNIKKIFTYVVVGALVSALFISCGKNPAEPGTEGNNGNNSVPTSTGVPATDLPNGYYQGNLQCKSCIMGNDFYADSSYEANKKELLEQDYKDWFTVTPFYLKIANNKLKWTREGDEQYIEDMEEVGALKSGSEYSVTYSFEDNDPTYGITKTKETIKFTISGDTISITTYILEVSSERKNDSGSDVELKYSVVATYEGTLDKYTTIESKDFPADLFGQYRDDKVYSKFTHESYNTLFRRIDTGVIEVIIISGKWVKKDTTDFIGDVRDLRIEKWTKTTKGGKTIKLESIEVTDKDSNGKEATVTYDYETKTLSGTYTDGSGTYLFNGKRIGDLPAIFQ